MTEGSDSSLGAELRLEPLSVCPQSPRSQPRYMFVVVLFLFMEWGARQAFRRGMKRTLGGPLFMGASGKENGIVGSEVTSSLRGKVAFVALELLVKRSLIRKGELQRPSSHPSICSADGARWAPGPLQAWEPHGTRPEECVCACMHRGREKPKSAGCRCPGEGEILRGT